MASSADADSRVNTAAETAEVDGVMYHRDFTKAHFPAILQSDDGTFFQFNIYALAGVSKFFANILDLPVEQAGIRTIPLPSASTKGLALALKLLRDHNDAGTNTVQVFNWPNHDELKGFLDVVMAYDLEIAAESLLKRSSTSTICTSAQAFGRLVLAITIQSRWIEHALLLTLSYDVTTMADWIEDKLREERYLQELYILHLQWKSRMLEVFKEGIMSSIGHHAKVDGWTGFINELAVGLLDETKMSPGYRTGYDLESILPDLRKNFLNTKLPSHRIAYDKK
ncbi:uncharacterized protein LOC62_04G006584 [Vanrija pseudolonga]|uniref:BTB domain-containing protein n=1 Tax=Vanrija pseudolonga TaxID=143232 RepID=A0AAF0YAD1_9TREE|nr:hypothetical protein LOC62_04G006584 [Vanrija pseudolonga]